MTAPGLSFAAFDVETANSDRGSICAIGVVIVHDGLPTDTYSWLCRPPAAVEHFSTFNTAIHGITADAVADAPRFAELWPQVLTLLGELPIVAHNAAFDIGAVRAACDYSGFSWPTMQFGCTMVWARRHLDLISYRLPIVSNELGVELRTHHDAAADASAAAGIALALASRTGTTSVEELAETLGTQLGRITASGWDGCRGRAKSGTDRLVIPATTTEADPTHPLYGQTVAFTGGLRSMTRQTAMDAIARCGATVAKSVTRRTTLLVIGDGFTGNDPAAFTTGKASKAVELREKGIGIEVLTESDLLELLGHDAPTTRQNTPRTVFVPPEASRWAAPGAGRASEPYWRWMEASLAADRRARGGEPCRICGAAIESAIPWQHRDRQVCGSRCNSALIRRWRSALRSGALPEFVEPVAPGVLAECARLPTVFGIDANAEFPREHGRWPKAGDVVVRFDLTTRYHRYTHADRISVPVWVRQVTEKAGGPDRVLLVTCDQYPAWGLHFIDELGRPERLMLGRFYVDGVEHLQWAEAPGRLRFERELISDVDEDGYEYLWEAHVFSRSPIEAVWTPARERLSARRKAVAAAASAYRKAAEKADVEEGEIGPVYPPDVFGRDGWVCQVCSEPLDPDANPRTKQAPVLHYLVPVSAGGDHVDSNVAAAHRGCARARPHPRPRG